MHLLKRDEFASGYALVGFKLLKIVRESVEFFYLYGIAGTDALPAILRSEQRIGRVRRSGDVDLVICGYLAV